MDRRTTACNAKLIPFVKSTIEFTFEIDRGVEKFSKWARVGLSPLRTRPRYGSTQLSPVVHGTVNGVWLGSYPARNSRFWN